MLSSFLALVVVVAQGSSVVTLELPSGRILASHELPGQPLSLFVAPDGTVFLPLAGVDATAVLPPGGAAVQLPGRLAPLFFREADRFYAVFPENLALLSYPERVPIASWPLPAGLGVRIAACLADGRVVALGSAQPRPRVLLVFPFDAGRSLEVPLPLPELGPLAVSSSFLAAASGNTVWIAPLGAGEGVSVTVEGEVLALAWSAEERELFALLARPESQLLRLTPHKKPGKAPGVKPLWTGQSRPQALVASEAGLVVLEDGGVRLLSPRGKLLAQAPLAGGRYLGLLPEHPRSGAIPWSDLAP